MVVSDSAISVKATRAGARIDALLVDTSSVARAVTVHNTLRSAVGCRSNHIGHTTTSSFVVEDLTNTVWSAWSWQTWIDNLRLNGWCHNFKENFYKIISLVI